MKKTLCIAIICIMVCTALCGCQPTPENPVVANKSEGQLEAAIIDSTNDSSLLDIPEHGDVVQDSFTSDEGRVQVNIDAEITRMDENRFPSCKVAPRVFSQEDADTLIEVLSNGAPLYGDELTKEAIEKRLVEYKQLNQTTGDFDQIIEELETEYSEAPSESDTDISTTFSESKAASSAYAEGIRVRFDRGQNSYVLSIQNSSNGKLSYAALNPIGYHDYVIIGDGENASVSGLTLDEAKLQAEQLCKDINCDLTMYCVYAVQDWALEEQPQAYQFVFTRNVDGVSVTYDPTNVIGDDISEEEETQTFQEPWPNESLSMIIDANGLQTLEWMAPTAVESMLSENVKLLPFEDVINIFTEMILLYNPGWDVSNANGVQIDITGITLGLARLQSGDEFYLVPVWDFYGRDSYLDSEGNDMSAASNESAKYRDSMYSLLTINAIDGNVVDRRLGY